MAQPSALVRRTETQISACVDWLEQNRDLIAQEAPQGYDLKRFKRTIVQLLRDSEQTNSHLAECSTSSLVQAIVRIVHLGLDVDASEAHVVARRNKHRGGSYEAHVMINYRGLLVLAKRAGEVVHVVADVVREGDEVVYSRGAALADNYFEHTPKPFNTGPIIGAYALFRLHSGFCDFEVMNLDEIAAARKKAARNSGAWADFFEQMAKKSVVRRGLQRFKLSPDDAAALRLSDRLEYDFAQDNANRPVSVLTERFGFPSPDGAPQQIEATAPSAPPAIEAGPAAAPTEDPQPAAVESVAGSLRGMGAKHRKTVEALAAAGVHTIDDVPSVRLVELEGVTEAGSDAVLDYIAEQYETVCAAIVHAIGDVASGKTVAVACKAIAEKHGAPTLESCAFADLDRIANELEAASPDPGPNGEASPRLELLQSWGVV